MRNVKRDAFSLTRARGALGLLALMLLSPMASACAGNPVFGDPRTMTFKSVEFLPPEPERVVLDNGMVVYLLEDHELPLITIEQAGSRSISGGTS